MLNDTERRVINLWNCCIWLVNLIELYDEARTCQRQISLPCSQQHFTGTYPEKASHSTSSGTVAMLPFHLHLRYAQLPCELRLIRVTVPFIVQEDLWYSSEYLFGRCSVRIFSLEIFCFKWNVAWFFLDLPVFVGIVRRLGFDSLFPITCKFNIHRQSYYSALRISVVTAIWNKSYTERQTK
jgi:hypothetical protein